MGILRTVYVSARLCLHECVNLEIFAIEEDTTRFIRQ